MFLACSLHIVYESVSLKISTANICVNVAITDKRKRWVGCPSAEIAGNEIADKLAKKAAEEAENMPEVDTPLTSIDVKRAVRDSCKIK